MNKNIVLILCSLITINACADEGGSPITDESEGNLQSPPTLSENPQTTPDPALISQIDSSVTVQAINGGLNPETTLISTRFFCYSESQTNVDQADTEVTVNGNFFTFEFSNGEVIQQTVGPSDFDPREANLEFTEFGQIFSGTDKDPLEEGCFQEGAALEAAQHRFALNTLDVGEFSCSVNGMDNGSIELLAGNRYSSNGQTGTYAFDSIVSFSSSRVGFQSGPLLGIVAEYSEDPNTGVQSMIIEAGNTSTTVCTRQTEPKPFKVYGPASAPSPMTPSASLEGVYFLDSSTLTAESRSNLAEFIDFRRTGHVRIGEPVQGGNNCDLTRPNGLPFCDQYEFDGTNLTLVTPWIVTPTIPVTVNGDGTLQTFGLINAEELTPVNPESIVGTWANQDVSSSGAAACIVGICSSSITERTFHFRADGQFLASFANQANNTFSDGLISTFSNNANDDQGTGSYQISGNTMRLTFLEGQSADVTIHLTEQGRLVIGNSQYSRP